MIEHKNIGEAVAAVMADVQRLEKADNNAFAKYKFTSVDDFKDHIRPLMAKHGLRPCVDEVHFEAIELVPDGGKRSVSNRYRFAFTLAFAGGASDPPEHLTITLPYTGAQTTGAARSYAMKEWLKGKFLASSGDIEEDADSHPQATYSAPAKPSVKPLTDDGHKPITEQQYNEIEVLLDEAKMDRAKFCETYAIKQASELARMHFADAVARLQKRKAAMAKVTAA